MAKYCGPPRLTPYRHGDAVPWRANSIEHLPLPSIKPDPGNARKHDRKQIDKLFCGMGEFGFTNPILIDENGRIIAGHARFEAAKRLGMSSVPCIRVSHLTESQKKALAIADNALTDASSWDDTLLRAVLLQLDDVSFDLDLTGLDTGTIDFHLGGSPGGAQADPAETFDPVDPARRAVSQLAFLWRLGPHRLLCGNALDSTCYERLLGADRADVIITDPPFNVPVVGPSPDWATFADAICERFVLENLYSQSVPHPGSSRTRRSLLSIPLEGDTAADWLLAIASANPLNGEAVRAEYHHPEFQSTTDNTPTLVDFGRAYDNPYLYRTMVQMGERLDNEVKLIRLAEYVIANAKAASPDKGAAIAVLGYRVLELRNNDAAAYIFNLIRDYDAATTSLDAPHVVRWRVSLTFLAGRLAEMIGDHPAAIDWYRQAASGDWKAFSPLLATKAIAAAFFEGRLHLAQGNEQMARNAFQLGVSAALAAAACPQEDLIGDPDRPIPFGLQEMAEVMDMGSQCANAIVYLHLWRRDPGLFWRQVDIRRFGLASWARDLERENERLRGKFQ